MKIISTFADASKAHRYDVVVVTPEGERAIRVIDANNRTQAAKIAEKDDSGARVYQVSSVNMIG